MAVCADACMSVCDTYCNCPHQLCLPEEDVWRSVLRWGCHRVGCSQQAGERSDQEREKLKLVGAPFVYRTCSDCSVPGAMMLQHRTVST